MSILSESIDGSCTCRPSPLPQYTGRQGWRQSLPQVPFLSISPPLGHASVTAKRALASAGSGHDGSRREITAARVYFFFFFFLSLFSVRFRQLGAGSRETS